MRGEITPLRPKTLPGIHRPGEAKGNLEVFIQAAKMRRRAPGPRSSSAPGSGQDHPVGIIANEMGVNVRITSGPPLKAGDLAPLLTNLNERHPVCGRIHRLYRSVEEVLYPAMEDYAIDIIIGKTLRPIPSGWICPNSPLIRAPRGRASCPRPARDGSALHSG